MLFDEVLKRDLLLKNASFTLYAPDINGTFARFSFLPLDEKKKLSGFFSLSVFVIKSKVNMLKILFRTYLMKQ